MPARREFLRFGSAAALTAAVYLVGICANLFDEAGTFDSRIRRQRRVENCTGRGRSNQNIEMT
jgi:hypothetical protein